MIKINTTTLTVHLVIGAFLVFVAFVVGNWVDAVGMAASFGLLAYVVSIVTYSFGKSAGVDQSWVILEKARTDLADTRCELAGCQNMLKAATDLRKRAISDALRERMALESKLEQATHALEKERTEQ